MDIFKNEDGVKIKSGHCLICGEKIDKGVVATITFKGQTGETHADCIIGAFELIQEG